MTELVVDISSKRYERGDRTLALGNMKFSAATGEFVAIVGPSGAGKTTLLHIIAGLDPHFEGTVRADGQFVTGHRHHPVRIGFVFQDPRLMPWLTVAQNIRLVLDEQAPQQVVEEVLAQVNLTGRERSYPAQLSGGMQRRVALARAFVVRPNLLLMDEPFISLDQPSAQRLRTLLLGLWRESKPTVLFVTHSLREAITLADRVLFLSAGPGHVVHEEVVHLPRPRELADPGIDEFHNDLLKRHPKILSGLVNEDTHERDADGPKRDERRMA